MTASGKRIVPLLTIILTIMISIGVGFALLAYDKPSDDAVHQKLLDLAEQINKNTPKMLDSNTKLDNVTVVKNAFIYNYTLVNSASTMISFNTLQSKLKSAFSKQLCAISGWRDLLSKGARVEYSYKGNDHKPIGTITVSGADCR